MLSPDGIGEIELGMPVADAYGTDTLGMYDHATGVVTPWDGSGADTICTRAGQAKRTPPDAAVVWMDESAGVTEVTIWTTISNPEVQTVEGLWLFDDFDRVLELYPDARLNDSNPSSMTAFVDNWADPATSSGFRDQNTGTVREMSVALAGGPGGCYE